MSKSRPPSFTRPLAGMLPRRLREPRRFLQVVAGPRQTGKTTLVQQVLAGLDLPSRFVSADEPTLRDREWLAAQWDEDTVATVRLRVVLLGSAPLLVQRGLSESLAGRFEVLHVPHWSLAEMREAFGFSLERFLL